MAKAKLCVGLDIGASSVKLCQLKRVKRGFGLVSFGKVDLPSETVVDGALMNSARIVEAIGELMETHRIRNKNVAISVAGHSVIIKKIPLPSMTREELENSIQWEAEQFIPFDIADVNIDVQVVNEHSVQQGQMDVVLVAAKKDFVNEYTSVVIEAGLEPVICDVDAFAVESAFDAGYPAEEGVVGLVNVGASKTNINIVSHGVSAFTRDLAIGGNNVTEEIQKQVGVSQAEAEALKLGRSTSDDSNVLAGVDRAVATVADNITGEVQRSIDFYTATGTDPSPTKLFLSGGTARLRALRDCMSDRIKVPVSVLDPFRNIHMKEEDKEYVHGFAPAAAVAVGLAMRYPGDG